MVTTAFVISTVLVMPLTAFLGRLFGQKRVYLVALALFLFGSALCGLARTLTMMILARVVQGLGPGRCNRRNKRFCARHSHRKNRAWHRRCSEWRWCSGRRLVRRWVVTSSTTTAGRGFFYINLPVGALAFLMVTRFVHEPEDIRAANQAAAAQQRKMSTGWESRLSVCLSTMQYVLEEERAMTGSSRGLSPAARLSHWSRWSVLSCTNCPHRRRLSICRCSKRGVFIGNADWVGDVRDADGDDVSSAFVYAGNARVTATQSGLALMPRSLVMIVAMPIVGRLYNRVSPRLFIGFGILLFAASAYQMSHYTLDTTARSVVSVLLLQGVAFACLFIPLTTVALSQVPRLKMADAAGSTLCCGRLAAAWDFRIFASLISRFATQAKYAMVANLVPGRPEVLSRLAAMKQFLVSRGADLATAEIGARRMLGGLVMQQAMVLSFEKLFLWRASPFVRAAADFFCARPAQDHASRRRCPH